MKPIVSQALKKLLAGTKRPIDAAYTIRKEAAYPEILELISRRNELPPTSRTAILGGERIVNWTTEQWVMRPPGFSNLQRSLTWMRGVFGAFSEDISYHHSLKQKFEAAIFYGKYAEAENILDAHQTQFGCSAWELHWRIALADLKGGDQSRREYVENFRNLNDVNIVSALSRMLDYLFDDGLSPEVIRTGVQSMLSSFDSQPKAFFQLVILGNSQTKASTPELLSWMELMPLVDRFNLTSRILSQAASENASDRKVIVNAVMRFLRAVDCNELRSLLILSDDPKCSTDLVVEEQVQQIWDAYFTGDYAKVIELSEASKESLPIDFGILELVAKSCIYLSNPLPGKDTLYSKLVSNLMVCFRRDPKMNQARVELDRFAIKYPFSALSTQITAFLRVSSTDEGAAAERFQCLRSATSANVFSPRMLEGAVRYEEQINFLGRLSKANSDFLSSKYLRKLATSPRGSKERINEQVPLIRELFFKGMWSYKRAHYQDSISYLNDFLVLHTKNESHPLAPFAAYEARHILIGAHLNVGNAEEAQSALVDLYVEKGNLPKPSLANRVYLLSEEQRSTTSKKCEYPILSSIVRKDPHAICIALKRFLRNQRCSVPSDLIDCSKSGFSEPTLECLFMKVCTLDILDSISALDTREKVENERLSLLEWIARKSPESARDVETEKLRIIQDAQLRAALDHIEENKVVLNLSSLRTAESSVFEAIFEDFYSKSKLARTQIRNDISAALGRAGLVLLNPQAVNEQLFDAFTNAFRSVRDRFLMSPHFGLEGCLSGKIRHGIFVEHMLKPLKSRQLFLVKGKIEKEQIVKSIASKLGTNDVDQDSVKFTTQTLESLSNKITALAREVREEWIQTKTEDSDGGGVFDYSFTNQKLAVIFSKSRRDETNQAKFIDHVFSVLTKRTEDNLAILRHRIVHDLRPKLVRIFQDAVAELRSRQIVAGTYVRDVLEAAQDTEVACDELDRWFREASGGMESEVDFKLVGATAIGMIERLNPEVRGSHSLDVESEFKVSGARFDSLVHLVFFMLENGVKHRSVPPDQYKCEVKIRAEGNSLVITFENNVESEATGKTAVEMVKERLREVAEDTDYARVMREGGSGFAKVIATIRFEFSNARPIVEAEVDGHLFRIKLSTLMEGLVA